MTAIILPEDQNGWRDQARRNKVENQTLRMNVKLYSASHVSHRQYLLFRTLLPPIVQPNQLNVQTFGKPHLMIPANQRLNCLAFNEYIANFTNRQAQATGWVWGGTDRLFRVPAVQQQQVIRNLTINGINRGATESTVNTAFLSFLHALSDLCPQPAQRLWTTERKKLVADFGTPQPERKFVAYTDGQLEDATTGRILALVECKRSWRDNHSPKVDMQEVAEIVAWIKNFPAVAGAADSRVLLSKDGTELYICVFGYDDGWLRYMEGGPGCLSRAGFATMRRFGPWDICRPTDMRNYAQIIMALLLL
ncbi:hypothetical protein BDQ94DRAFT_175609 [Aspergillus welwitschiae]|uniref:Uncharacterized protein n=1 Tax=Aspergillus welwitschiae TaxID=1341132 RepID=A0A3F3PKL3_9EURO|nr:hypothetical protein BDQ94DRAFT_175609 [Aspergillus welwitschiae]RDH27447.1 hypothetical protein BDQ94DRAFT_175609 [Aspergillus welwitschiae]